MEQGRTGLGWVQLYLGMKLLIRGCGSWDRLWPKIQRRRCDIYHLL